MPAYRDVNVGIGFATGRKSFRKVLKTYLFNFKESGLTERENVRLKLLVAYDLRYQNTTPADYTRVRPDLLDMLDAAFFIGKATMQREMNLLVREGVINRREAALFFGSGYAAKRNAVLYTALKNKLDYLIFFDDDEYPLAVTNTRRSAIWGGQHVLTTHLRYIPDADITNGHHCGYISPIPYIAFNDVLDEDTFRLFIEAISNDIINWQNIRAVMENGGVTYADTKVLVSNQAEEVPLYHRTKFISGSNLCLNLRDPLRVNAFYNPPGARGEDTFLSTCLAERRVLRVPCYTFHDGFSTYQHIMDGVLPIKLKYISADSEAVIRRFYQACSGWIRYKPLLLYITRRENYDEEITRMQENIARTLPKLCAYFDCRSFMNIPAELEQYHRNVGKHYRQFIDTQRVWRKITAYLEQTATEA